MPKLLRIHSMSHVPSLLIEGASLVITGEGEDMNGLQVKPKYLTVTYLVAVTMIDLAAVISTSKVENTSLSYLILSLQEDAG